MACADIAHVHAAHLFTSRRTLAEHTPGTVAIIGAGLAGSEAALTLARRGVRVTLYEMRPAVMTPAHTTGLPAELVCSNSLKTDRLPTAHGLLKAELGLLRSPLLELAQTCRVPAGSALAVNRQAFSEAVWRAIEENPHITFVNKEAAEPPSADELCIIAAGPLASESLTRWLQSEFPARALSFYDAIAPIVSADSVDTSVAFHASRWDADSDDYLNCPFSEEQFRAFRDALVAADKLSARAFEHERFFEACLPVEVVAARDFQALTFGTLRPVGLIDPRSDRRPFAVCQLRRENAAGTAYGLVGFQTRLRIAEQKRVFRMIPGLARAEFLRFGSIHRNTYLHSPQLLAHDLSFRDRDRLFLAGQLCGNEGYTESIATGHAAGLFAWARLAGKRLSPPTPATALGALLRHVTVPGSHPYTPTNINFGLLDALPSTGRRVPKARKKELLCARALEELKRWISGCAL